MVGDAIKMNKEVLLEHVKANVTVYLFMTTLLLTGIVFGAIIVNSMSFVQKQDLFFHVNQFFTKINNDEPIVSTHMLKKSFFFHLQYLLFILLLGLTIIGIPLIWLFIFLKGLVIGFSVGFIVNQLGFKGLWLATVSIAPQNILIIPIYIIAASLANLFSLFLFRKVTSRTVSVPIGRPFLQYVTGFTLLVVGSFAGSLIETFISYEAVKMTVHQFLS